MPDGENQRFEAAPGAFILEKQETVVAPVAVIFGYGDNRSACQEIAEILIRVTSRRNL